MSKISMNVMKKFFLDYTLAEIDKLNNQEFVFRMMLEELYESFGFDKGGEYTINEIKREMLLLDIQREELRGKYCKMLN